MITLSPKTGVISCRVFQPELSALGIEESRVVYLEQNYHRNPDELREKIRESISVLERNADLDSAILLYGYCGGGLANLSSERLKLIIPRVHDCIPLLLGACPLSTCPDISGAFYLSPGWIDHGLTPYTEFLIAVEKYGREDALWVGMEMLKSYNEVVLVEIAAEIQPHHRNYARKMACLFGLSFREIKSRPSGLISLFSGRDTDSKRVIQPGNSIALDLYPAFKCPGEQA